MKAEYIRKLTRVGSSLALVLPPALLEKIGAQRADSFVVSMTPDYSLLLTPLALFVGTIPPELKDKGIIKL